MAFSITSIYRIVKETKGTGLALLKAKVAAESGGAVGVVSIWNGLEWVNKGAMRASNRSLSTMHCAHTHIHPNPPDPDPLMRSSFLSEEQKDQL